MPTSGKIIRGSTGKLALAVDGRLKRCGCCSPYGACDFLVKATPCYLELDLDCNDIVYPPYLWVCVGATCSNGLPMPNLATDPATFLFGGEGGRCYQTDPSTFTSAEKAVINPGDIVLEEGVCVGGGGCLNTTVCGTPFGLCQCVCATYTYDPHQRIDCCFGRITDNVLYNNNWSFDYTYTFRRWLTIEILDGEPCELPSCTRENVTRDLVVEIISTAEGAATDYNGVVATCPKKRDLRTRSRYKNICPGPSGSGWITDETLYPDGVFATVPSTYSTSGTTTGDYGCVGSCCGGYTETYTVDSNCYYYEARRTLIDVRTGYKYVGPDTVCTCRITTEEEEITRIDYIVPSRNDRACKQCEAYLYLTDPE